MSVKKYNIIIPVPDVELEGDLTVPDKSKGLVIFSHGSGSSRKSPRNQMVAQVLNQNDFATLLFDLLTPEEDEIYENRFDIALLSKRLITTAEWIMQQQPVSGLPVGFFGASTGAASALYATAVLQNKIKAVVSRGGRPDLAIRALPKVVAPVLLIVGDLDEEVVELNQQAHAALTCKKQLVLVRGATHLFEEPGKLNEVAQLATQWYKNNLK